MHMFTEDSTLEEPEECFPTETQGKNDLKTDSLYFVIMPQEEGANSFPQTVTQPFFLHTQLTGCRSLQKRSLFPFVINFQCQFSAEISSSLPLCRSLKASEVLPALSFFNLS